MKDKIKERQIEKIRNHYKNHFDVQLLLSEIGRLKEERDKLIEGLREIDTHIRSTPEPVQHIVETLKRVLPEYQEYVAVEVKEAVQKLLREANER